MTAAVVTDVPMLGSALWLTFDEHSVTTSGTLRFVDAGGRWVGELETANGGAVRLAPGPPTRGQAIALPASCEAPEGCPRALVTIPDAAPLDPEDADFSYGATVRLTPEQAAKGSNVVQKGRFGSAGGQWKLQVDTLDGLPSCVVRGELNGEPTLVSVRSSTSVADGAWHAVTCTKTSDSLSIEVDKRTTTTSEAIGTVSNEQPVHIGSAGVGDGDDQFHGHIDDVFLWVDQ